MRRMLAYVVFLLLMPCLAFAQDRPATLELAGDTYRAGQTVILSDPVAADAFLAGQTVTSNAPVAGTLHMAGQTLRADETVGENLYAAGQTITVTERVAGNLTAVGQSVTVGDVGRNLRLTAQDVSVLGRVEGAALLTGQTVLLSGQIDGDAVVTADTLSFGPEATVTGTLTVNHTDPDSVAVPETVAPADRVVRVQMEEWEAPSAMPVSKRTIWRGFLGTFVFVAFLAAAMAALVPNWLAGLRRQLISEPARSLWIGFLTLSALIGAVVVLSLTVIGLLGVPVEIAVTVIGCVLGYAVGAYALGIWILSLIGRPMPDHWGERVLGAVVGAVAIAAIGMIPFFGWLAALAVTMAGLGAITISLLRPRFFAEAEA